MQVRKKTYFTYFARHNFGGYEFFVWT